MPEPVAERRPLAGVAQAFVHAALGQADRERRDRDPALVQDLQELGVTAAARAEQVDPREPGTTLNDSSLVSEAHQPTLEYSGPTVSPASRPAP